MKRVQLSNSSLEVSQFCFGCWGIVSDFHWGERDEAEAIGAIHAALDAGVNYFDTAAVYGDGASELLLGKVLAGQRNNLVIASKVRADQMRPEQIAPACEESLRRLNTDYIDLYQTHWTDPEVPIADSWAELVKLQEAGKVREIGVCNMGTSDLQAVQGMPLPVSNQLPYNLLWRAIELDILPACRENQISALAYSPLMHGLLADKYQTAGDVPDGRARSRHFNTERDKARHGESGCENETFAAIAAIRMVSARSGRSMADVALSWVAQQEGVSSVIVGVRNAEQLQQNIATLDDPISPELLGELDAATESLREVLGPNPDMWQGTDGSRFN